MYLHGAIYIDKEREALGGESSPLRIEVAANAKKKTEQCSLELWRSVENKMLMNAHLRGHYDSSRYGSTKVCFESVT